jgi:bisphosphoglycerate-dependent phosphoglycerate mutase
MMLSSKKKGWALALVALAALAAPSAAQEFKRTEEPKARQGETPRPAAGAKTADAEARAIAQKAAHFEKVYRERQARIRKLLAIYREKGDEAKIRELQDMQAKLEKRHTNAMQGFRAQRARERERRRARRAQGAEGSGRAPPAREEARGASQAAGEGRAFQREAARRERSERQQSGGRREPLR